MIPLKFLTVNIEGIKSNNIAALDLLQTSDILAFQEHWLFEFETPYLHELCDSSDMDYTSRSVDEKDPIPLYQRPRGYGGVALAWSKNLSRFAKKIPDGSERILPVLFESEYDKVCVISVYLPCQGSYSEATYQDSLDILSTVIWKYKNSHTIVILGDFNASLFDQRGSRDSKFSRWCRDHNVVPHPSYPKTGTHLHHRGSGQSTIDYILCTNPDIISNVSVGQCHPTNTSSHLPIMANIALDLHVPVCDPVPTTDCITKLDWSKCDTRLYQDITSDFLDFITPMEDLPSLSAFCDTFTDILTHAAQCAIPSRRIIKSKRQWDGDVSRAMAISKQSMREWNQRGRPSTGPAYETRKAAKKSLRKTLRSASARKRNKIYSDIMEASQRDTRLFHRLIRHQRGHSSPAGSELLVNGNLVCSAPEVLRLWTEHLSRLATPSDDHNFDSIHHKLVKEDLLVIKYANSPSNSVPLSYDELCHAIKALNSGHATDIHGLKAEHLKHSSTKALDHLQWFFNTIIPSGRVPGQLQSAYILPVHKKGKDKFTMDDYRGITITPTLSKTLEHITLARVAHRLDQHPLQYGFTKSLLFWLFLW